MSAKTKTGSGTRSAEQVLIHVWVRTLEPVAGRIALDGRPSAAFAGWLHLLQRLSDLMAFAQPAVHEASVRQLRHHETKEEK